MTCKDLMVGDYVTLSANTNVRMQVVSIVPMINTIDLADTDNHGAIDEYPIEALSGIPITPEILEKNGWKNDGYFASFCINDFRIVCDCCNLAIIGRNQHVYIDAPIRYVHELQHCLRLLKIEKEIVL